jgi:hypothetical protein
MVIQVNIKKRGIEGTYHSLLANFEGGDGMGLIVTIKS